MVNVVAWVVLGLIVLFAVVLFVRLRMEKKSFRELMFSR